MSDNIPLDIQIEVIKLLPIKSLIRFRSVSKPWKSVIESSDFIADYTVRCRDQPHHLLIRYQNITSYADVYVSIADNGSFPLNKVSPTVPHFVNQLEDLTVVGTSCGLVCLTGDYDQGPYKCCLREMAVLWNPSIGKSVAIAVPDDATVSSTFGFGVCPATSDPKIVKTNKSVAWRVEVFNLSSGVWRISPCNPPDKLVEFKPYSQSFDRFIYWLGVDTDTNIMIISFDLLSEEFGEIHLPGKLALLTLDELYLFKRSDSLVVVNETILDEKYDVWMMENGISKSFIKLFTFNMPNGLYSSSLPLGFSRNGEIMMAIDDTDDSEKLVAYDPLSEHINDIGINGINSSLIVSSYTESLILLDQKDTLYNEEMSI